MIKITIALILLSIGSAYAELDEVCDDMVPGIDIGGVAGSATKKCSPVDLKEERKKDGFNLSSYYGHDQEKLCTCLKDAKFNEARVPFGRKKKFVQYEYDKAIREKLGHSLRDLVGNFTKFNNMILTKDHLGNISKGNAPLCNLKTLAADIEALQKLEGTPACPSPKGFMKNRLTTIFGTDNMKELPNKLAKQATDIAPGSCMSNQMYLNLRSSSGASSKGFSYLTDIKSGKDFKSYFHNPEEPGFSGPLKDLLSYDVVFNLAYRDENFRKSLQQRIDVFTNTDKKRLYDIYNDKETLALVYNSLNSSCTQLTQNLKGFLCANEYPKMNPATLNLHLDDYFKNEKENPITKGSMRDFFTWDFACNEDRRANTHMRTVAGVLSGAKKQAVKLSPEEEAFDQYIENTILVKNATKDVFSTDKKSDYSKFNEMFCKGREGKAVTKNELPEMFKTYLQELKQKGIDINSMLAPGTELSKELGLAIDTTKDPMFILTKDKDIDAGKLPKINQFKWEKTIALELEKKGLKPEEISQLYAIIEMQTNRRFTEMEDLKKKLMADNQGFQEISVREIEAVVRKDPEAVARVQERILSVGPTANPVMYQDFGAWMTERHTALNADLSTQNNNAQDVLLNSDNMARVRAEAEVYNANGGTFDSEYRERTAQFSPDQYGKLKLPDQPSDPTPPSVTTNNPPSNTTPPTATSGSAQDDGPIQSQDDVSDSSDVAGTPVIANNQPLPSTPSIGNGGSGSGGSSSNYSEPETDLSEGSGRKPRTPASVDDSYSADTDPDVKALRDKISRIKDQIKDSQSDYDRAKRELENSSKQAARSAHSRIGGNNFQSTSSYNPEYNYPKNVPFKSQDGSYSYPKNKTSELSSSKDGTPFSKGGDHSSGGSVGGGGGSSGAGGGSSVGGGEAVSNGGLGPIDSAALASVGQNLPGGGKSPSSAEKEADARKRLKLSVYEHHKIIPHAIVDVVGSIDKAVILLGLEGKRFKTIEVVEYAEKDSVEQSFKYYIRTYDFVPEGDFEDYKEDFISKEAREKAHVMYFSYPRTKENLKVSKKYAAATREVEKEEVNHNLVLQMQNDIMNEKELRDTLTNVSEKLK